MPTEFYKGSTLQDALNKAIKDRSKGESHEERRKKWFRTASIDEETLRKFLADGFPNGLSFRDIEKEILESFLKNPLTPREELAKNLGVSSSTFKTNLERAKFEIRRAVNPATKGGR